MNRHEIWGAFSLFFRARALSRMHARAYPIAHDRMCARHARA